MTESPSFNPTVIGMSAFDAIRFADTVTLCVGGVSTNIACVMGQLNHRARFVSPAPEEEFAATLNTYFAKHNTHWVPLPVQVAMPFFEAYIGENGKVEDENFYDNGVFEAFNADIILNQSKTLLENTQLLVSTTDMTASSLNAIGKLAYDNDLPYYLVSANLPKAQRIPKLDPKPHFLAINQGELESIVDEPLGDFKQIARLTEAFVAPKGGCLVTLGSKGSVLILHGSRKALYQDVPSINCPSTVCAGDTLCASLIAYYFDTGSWEQALTRATHITLSFLSNRTRNEAFEPKPDPKIVLPPIQVTEL